MQKTLETGGGRLHRRTSLHRGYRLSTRPRGTRPRIAVSLTVSLSLAPRPLGRRGGHLLRPLHTPTTGQLGEQPLRASEFGLVVFLRLLVALRLVRFASRTGIAVLRHYSNPKSSRPIAAK